MRGRIEGRKKETEKWREKFGKKKNEGNGGKRDRRRG